MESLSMQKGPPQLPFSAHNMQVKKDLLLYVGVGGWMDGEWVLVWYR